MREHLCSYSLASTHGSRVWVLGSQLCKYRISPLYKPASWYADTREQSNLTNELKRVIRALQDIMTLTQLVLRGQLRPVTSSASTKRLEDYRRRAIEYYYGSHADMSRIMCMVTGEELEIKQTTAGHIYRQGWGTGIVVRTWA